MKTLFLTLVLLVTFAACKKSAIAPGTPSCIRNEIAANKDDKNWEVGKIDEYEFQGKIVYAFEPDGRIIADGSTKVVTDKCTLVCYFGGFGGPDIILCNGVNFYRNAKLIRNIWIKN